jgi:hypothetical protein
MTLPDERYRAVTHTEQFLIRLAGGHYARVPRAVREEARSLLRHYPNQYDMMKTAQTSPDIFQERMDDLHRMILRYEGMTPEQDHHEGSTAD